MSLTQDELTRGVELFTAHLEKFREENPEISDLHEAFEYFCQNKYSLGSSSITQNTGGKGDLGIDFYSTRDRKYQIGQCKIPELDWLEANPGKARKYGPSVVNDPRDALRYLFGQSKATPNEAVKHLYGLVERDRNQDEFSLTFFLIVYGRLDDRAKDALDELVNQYDSKNVKIILRDVDDLVDEFLVGAAHATGEIKVDLGIDKEQVLRAHNYYYFLANAADLYDAFVNYGWRLFDKNLRYEIKNSPVNGDIVESLRGAKGRKRFHHYNNGLIVVANGVSFRDGNTQVRIGNPQIVNGLQTVKSIYNAVTGKVVSRQDLENECLVQVKVIQTNDPDFVSTIVYSTNNQNPMAARNLKANNREQKFLKTAFANLAEGWFYQIKQGEWVSLTGEEERFFKPVIGVSPAHFRSDPQKKGSVRLIDNEDAAKAWLAFIGYSDKAGDRVTHYFSDDEIYQLAFTKCPSDEHWNRFRQLEDFDKDRDETLVLQQGHVHQYLLAHFLWEFTKFFIPSPKDYREEGLQEGVRAGKIKKSGGSIVSTSQEQDSFLSDNSTYQTWRLMSNMKELLVEAAARLLAQKYGPLEKAVCQQLLCAFDAKGYLHTGDVRSVARNARQATDLPADAVFSRIFGLLKFASSQFWEDNRQRLAATSRIRTLLLRRDIAAQLKKKLDETNQRKSLDQVWKPGGKTFLESLPKLD